MTLASLFNRIDDPRQPIIKVIYNDYKDLIHSNPGSMHIHQVWAGGLGDHLADMFRLCRIEYCVLSEFVAIRNETLPFTIGSAQVAIFCHDAEKLIVYGDRAHPRCAAFLKDSSDPTEKSFKEGLKWDVLAYWKSHYGLTLTEAEINAIKYTHGEGDDYRNDRRVMNELAAFIGNIDRTSARILYNSGKDFA